LFTVSVIFSGSIFVRYVGEICNFRRVVLSPIKSHL
jgi:hypothetical protein